jgi:hypothetical protein
MGIHRRSSWKVRLLVWLTVAAVLGLAGTAAFRRVWVGVCDARPGARLGVIKISIMGYCDRYGLFPPQYLADAQGRPAHSWRVLILEFMHPELYRRYRFDEPWNGPHNSLLATEMPEGYRSPFVGAKSTITQYVGIVGEDTLWRGTTRIREGRAFRIRVNPLIWLVEVADSDIHWMEPRDIPLEQALAGINVAEGAGIKSNYSRWLPAVTAAGSYWVPLDISPDEFRALLTVTPEDDTFWAKPDWAKPDWAKPDAKEPGKPAVKSGKE